MVICSSFIITGCGSNDFKKKSTNDVVKYDNITKIEFYDGRGGINKPFTLEDLEIKKTLIKMINVHKFKNGAGNRIRTCMVIPLVPETSASANSAIPANKYYYNI